MNGLKLGVGDGLMEWNGGGGSGGGGSGGDWGEGHWERAGSITGSSIT